MNGEHISSPSSLGETAKASGVNGAEVGVSAVGVHMDLNEGQFVALGCLGCRADVTARIGIATPFRLYVAALDCPECGGQLCEWDVMTDRTFEGLGCLDSPEPIFYEDRYAAKVDLEYELFKENF